MTEDLRTISYTDSMLNSSNSTLPNIIIIDEITSLTKFGKWYEEVHGYVSVVVCIFGIISNIMNVMVLTQKNMQTPTNYLLTALAIADMLTMTSYLPTSIYFYCITAPNKSYNHSRGWMIFYIFHNNFIITCHTIAMWLTVALAVFRYILVCHHTLGPRLCNFYRTKITIIAVFCSTILFCVPNYIIFKTCKLKSGGYWFEKNSFVTDFVLSFNYWLFGVVLKVAPCVLLTVLSSLLIRAMRLANEKRKHLKSQGKRAEFERANEHNRTTAMLVAVVLCFVLTELPQGTLAFLSGVDLSIFNSVYTPLGDVFDIMVLINSSVNFLLYCTMSRLFRQTFKTLFIRSWTRRQTTPRNQNGIHYSTIDTQTTKL